jgi:hypothetical protein
MRLAYLDVALDFASTEAFCGDREVSMYGRPVPVELLIGDFGEFVEIEGELYARLGVGLCIIGELGMGKVVLDFLECHSESNVLMSI